MTVTLGKIVLRALAAAALFRFPLLSSTPPPPSSPYLVTRFAIAEGNPALIVNSIVQSRDGFLWIANASVPVVRFDGLSFYALPAIHADQAALTPDGDLWLMSSRGVLTRMPADSLHRFGTLPATEYRPPTATAFNSILAGRHGGLWVAARDGLYRFERGAFSPVISGLSVDRVEESANGHLHLVTSQGYLEWDGSRAVPHPEVLHQLGIQPSEIFHVFEDRRGVVWFATAVGVARRTGDSVEWLPPTGRGHATRRIHEDQRGVLWFARTDGLYRSADRGLELVDPGIQARALFGDRDGNLWIGTNGDGLIRLRERATRLFTPADGLPNKLIMTVLADHDGAIWTGANCGGLSRLDGERFRTYTEKDGLLNTCVFSLAEDANRDLWVGTYGGGAFRFHDGRFTQFSKAQGLASDVVTNLLAARDGSIWFATPAGVSRLAAGQVRNYATAGALPKVFTLVEDRNGGIWAGTVNGVERFAQDRFVMVAPVADAAILIGDLQPGRMFLRPGPNQPLAALDHNRPVTVAPFSTSHVIADRNGDLWFCGTGLQRVSPRALLASRAPDQPFEFEEFGWDDGVPPDGCSFGFPSEAIGRDGKFWMATFTGLAMLDLPRMPKSGRPAPLYMGEITVGKTQREPATELRLAPGTHHVELRFHAIEVVSPQKIRMQYRLDGVDGEWLDAVPPGPAIYSNIPVGTHAFHLRASNRDGAWDLNGIVYNVTQEPYFYETRLFRAAMAGLFALLLMAAYRFRVRQIAAAMNARFDERLAERTRIARDFHDTLLQTIQGTRIVAGEALKANADPAEMRRAMERVSGWLDRAVREGREALSSLRSSAAEPNGLAAALRRAAEECHPGNSLDFQLAIQGSAMEVHPIVRDEVYRIAYEAIRNACTHSGATLLVVELSYVHDLVVRVRDNGRGFDSGIAAPTPGHFGLLGMHERAARIRGKLTISTPAGGGTQVELIVPRSVVFHEPAGRWARLRRLWRRAVRSPADPQRHA